MARDLTNIMLSYLIGALVAFVWLLLGVYVYLRPIPADSLLGADFNHDIGTALVAQGLIFFVTFVAVALVRFLRGNREQEVLSKDREMLREIHEWIIEQRGKGD